MVRLTILLSMLVLLACGAQEASQMDESAEAPPVSMPGETTPTPETPAPSVSTDARVEGCLDLVRQARFERALPVCLEALEIAPDNPEVQAAVERARAETAKRAAAEALPAGADEAVQALPGELGR